VKKRWKLGLAVLIVVLAGALIHVVVVPGVRRWRAARLLRSYRAQPTQRLAQSLAWLLDQQAVPPEMGEEILLELLRPRVKTRASYRLGHRVHFSLARAFPLRFSLMDVDTNEEVEAQEGSRGSSSGGGNSLDAQPRFLRLEPAPKEPGTYDVKVHYRYKLTPFRSQSRWLWPTSAPFPTSLLPGSSTRRWREKTDKPVYWCAFTVPVQVRVVPEQDAETVALVSSPALDAAMRAAFRAVPSTYGYGYGTPSGRRRSRGGIHIVHSNVPADAAFEMAFRDASGKEKVLQHGIRVRKGTSGHIQVEHPSIGIEEPGVHKGTVVLRPDREGAYVDPEIGSIWNRALEFPMSLTVVVDGSAEAQSGGGWTARREQTRQASP